MGKHSYTVGCECSRCQREAGRRAAQGASAAGRAQQWARPVQRARRGAQDRREATLMRLWDAGRDDLSDWS